jgi:hypothetical protein
MSEVALRKATDEAVTPDVEKATVAAAVKLVPVIEKPGVVLFWLRAVGLTEVTVGGDVEPLVTVRHPLQLNFPPSGLVRLRLYAPGVTVEATLTERVSWVALTKVAGALMPLWLNTLAPDWKLVPVSVTARWEVPWGREFGLTRVMVGEEAACAGPVATETPPTTVAAAISATNKLR